MKIRLKYSCAEDKWIYELHIQAMDDANHS